MREFGQKEQLKLHRFVSSRKMHSKGSVLDGKGLSSVRAWRRVAGWSITRSFGRSRGDALDTTRADVKESGTCRSQGKGTTVPDERMDPVSACSASFWEHAYRYRFALRYVLNKCVLDIACGEGYGTAALQNAGSSKVVGMDLSQEICARARRKYEAPFCAADAHAIPLANRSVDVIVSFETIEHVAEPETFLDECVRVLAPRGVLIVSTPDKAVHREAGEPNPYHCSEMYEEDFISLLSSRFTHTERYVQIVRVAPWWSPRSLAATHARWVRVKGGWRAREWMRSRLCPEIYRDLSPEDRHAPVQAIRSQDRFLASWVNPYSVRRRSRGGRERSWYLIAVCHD
jgi:ubiquinone/menaquinone biosynthesis C-methylase UbiE